MGETCFMAVQYNTEGGRRAICVSKLDGLGAIPGVGVYFTGNES